MFDWEKLTISKKEPFQARGKLQPGQFYNINVDGWWSFEPDIDLFQPSVLDMSFLNEDVAGSQGFIQAQGMRYLFWVCLLTGDKR